MRPMLGRFYRYSYGDRPKRICKRAEARQWRKDWGI